MRKQNKILLVVAVLAIGTIVVWRYYSNNLLKEQYWNALQQQEKEYIEKFYKSSFRGIVTYIKRYEETPIKYVVGITDSLKNETTIGKVEIKVFSNVSEGDTITKHSNTFELLINGHSGKGKAIVKYNLE